MTTSSPRERAEAAFGHVQLAASEMIAAAREGLELLDDAVSTADLGEILDTVHHLSRIVLKKSRPGVAPSDAAPQSPVQRISVR